MQAVKPLTTRESLKALRLSLYDEERKEMVSFGALREGRAGGWFECLYYLNRLGERALR
jgi:hypothetical protein